jgi:hypothetical protein
MQYFTEIDRNLTGRLVSIYQFLKAEIFVKPRGPEIKFIACKIENITVDKQ